MLFAAIKYGKEVLLPICKNNLATELKIGLTKTGIYNKLCELLI